MFALVMDEPVSYRNKILFFIRFNPVMFVTASNARVYSTPLSPPAGSRNTVTISFATTILVVEKTPVEALQAKLDFVPPLIEMAIFVVALQPPQTEEDSSE